MLTFVRLAVGIPTGITGIKAVEDEPALNSTLPLTGKQISVQYQ
jgi:hypothetical protein